MEEIYNYIVHNKIDGSYQLLPFAYTICGDTVSIDLVVYNQYWPRFRSIFQGDYNIHKVTGCTTLHLYSKDEEVHLVWNGQSYFLDIFT